MLESCVYFLILPIKCCTSKIRQMPTFFLSLTDSNLNSHYIVKFSFARKENSFYQFKIQYQYTLQMIIKANSAKPELNICITPTK